MDRPHHEVRQLCVGRNGEWIDDNEVLKGFNVTGKGEDMWSRVASDYGAPKSMMTKNVAVRRVSKFLWHRSSRRQEREQKNQILDRKIERSRWPSVAEHMKGAHAKNGKQKKQIENNTTVTVLSDRRVWHMQKDSLDHFRNSSKVTFFKNSFGPTTCNKEGIR